MLRLIGAWLAAGRRVTLVLGSRCGPLTAEIPIGVELIDVRNGRFTHLFVRTPCLRRERETRLLTISGRLIGWHSAAIDRSEPHIKLKWQRAVKASHLDL